MRETDDGGVVVVMRVTPMKKGREGVRVMPLSERAKDRNMVGASDECEFWVDE